MSVAGAGIKTKRSGKRQQELCSKQGEGTGDSRGRPDSDGIMF